MSTRAPLFVAGTPVKLISKALAAAPHLGMRWFKKGTRGTVTWDEGADSLDIKINGKIYGILRYRVGLLKKLRPRIY